MTLPTPPAPPRWAVVANLIGLTLVVLSVIGVFVAAWATCWQLGVGVTSVAAGALGVWLMTRDVRGSKWHVVV